MATPIEMPDVEAVGIEDAYVTVSAADDYVRDEMLTRTAWNNALTPDKTIALKMASAAIDRLPLKGAKADAAQVNAFPRGTDTIVPTDIEDACVLLAYAYVDGKDLNIEHANLAVESRGFGKVSITSNTETNQRAIALGIISAEAWVRLRPYVRDDTTFKVKRV